LSAEQILTLILFSIVHWVLAVMVLDDLARRKKVRGGRKAPWAILIIFLTFFGSFLYLLFHPGFFYDDWGW
jgi:hypothetical protein